MQLVIALGLIGVGVTLFLKYKEFVDGIADQQKSMINYHYGKREIESTRLLTRIIGVVLVCVGLYNLGLFVVSLFK